MKRARVLLAEDHKRMREKIARVVEREVGAVGDGQALLEAESRLNPDVCILDISMPILNGIETANLIQQSRSKTKIIFLTSHEHNSFLEAALKTGALGYVLKPRMASDLRPAIREALADNLFISPSMP